MTCQAGPDPTWASGQRGDSEPTRVHIGHPAGNELRGSKREGLQPYLPISHHPPQGHTAPPEPLVLTRMVLLYQASCDLGVRGGSHGVGRAP